MISDKGWCDDNENLTSYRNLMSADGSLTVVLLIGVDRVTDASSMADFHHCDLRMIWEQELGGTFAKWIGAALDPSVGYDDDTVRHFDWVLQPLVERGVADVLQISTLLQNLDLSGAQDGRDAERVLLTSLGRFNLPEFSTYKFASRRAFGTYLDDALGFFAYDSFLEERSRQKAMKTVSTFVENNPLGEVFDPAERRPFATDQAFVEAVTQYVATADRTCRAKPPEMRLCYHQGPHPIVPRPQGPGPAGPGEEENHQQAERGACGSGAQCIVDDLGRVQTGGQRTWCFRTRGPQEHSHRIASVQARLRRGII